MDMRVEPQRRLSTEELMLLNCGAGEDSWESPLDSKEIKPVNLKENQPWIFTGSTDAEAPIVTSHLMWRVDSLEKTWCWERLRAAGEDDRGWDGWMASLTQWTRVWANSGRQWRTGMPGVLQSMGWQTAGHNLATEQQQGFQKEMTSELRPQEEER